MTDLARYFSQSTRPAVMTPLSVANTGAEAIGQGIAQLGGAIDEIQQRDENFWIQKTMSDIDTDNRTLWDSATTSAQDGAGSFEQTYLGGLDQRYEQARQTAPSPRALRGLETQIISHRNNQAAAAQGFATQEKFEFRRDTIVNEADNIAQELYRNPATPTYQPLGALTPPGLPAGAAPASAEGYYSSGMIQPHTGVDLPANLDQWQSSYYSPRDFADGANMSDRSGGVMVSKRVVSSLDWVTDQFGMGKLQINSGFRSPESNVKRASSGPNGPHTHGEAFDVQVRDLPQAEKNRLYSLFKAAGANSFGFGEGVLHVEWRNGEAGGGRGGDHEWTYGNAAAYQLVPVAGPSVAGQSGTASTTGAWQTVNQYPFLPVVALTARNETGTSDLATGSLSVAADTSGTVSYGILGLNTKGMLGKFVATNGEQFGLTAAPGSAEFTQQWQAAVRSDPEGMVRAQLQFHEGNVVAPAQRAIVDAGAVGVANDPRVVAFASDLIIQYGAAGAAKHIKAGAGARDASSFVNAVGESTKRSLDTDFATALSEDPGKRNGLMNRIDNRARDAMGISAATVATGNVPRWDGPIPNIEASPGYGDRMARLDAMVDTMGGTPNQRRDLKAQYRGQITRAWLSRVAEINPPAAMAALMSGRYDNDLEVADTASLMGGAQSAYASMETQIRNAQKELIANLKVEAQTALADEVVSVSRTGQSLNVLSDAHKSVLTPEQREQLSLARFQYDTNKEIAASRNEELPSLLEALRPEGDGFANEQVRYDYAQKAIAEHLKAQQADPAQHVLDTYPQLAERWQQAITSRDPNAIAANIRAMSATQASIGIKNPQLLPGSFAGAIAAEFNDGERPEADRVGALMSTILAAEDPAHQRMIFDQLVKAGVPATTEAAVEAEMRGDAGAARRLFKATMLDPAKLPGAIAEKTSSINEAIQSQLMDQGQIGDLYYGVSNGDANNFAAATRDAPLILSAVQIRLQAGEDLNSAVAAVGRDMYGDVRPVTGNWDVNAQILLPTDQDPKPVLNGLAGLKPAVREALDFVAPVMPAPEPVGAVERGNINLDAREIVKNEDGSISTEASFSFEQDGVEVLIPTVFDGKVNDEEAAIARYEQTGEHLGKFSSPAAAEKYAEALHQRQDAFYSQRANGGKAVASAVLTNYADMVMREGYFRNSGDGYVFIDPYVGGAVMGKDGKPLTFTEADVMGASKAWAEQAAQPADPSSLNAQEIEMLNNSPDPGSVGGSF